MNQACLTGNVVRDPETRTTQQGTTITKFSLAVRRDQNNTDFINCTAFGKTAELIDQYVVKGMRLGVTGSIQTGSYEKDGRKVYTFDVNVKNVEFLSDKREEANEGW